MIVPWRKRKCSFLTARQRECDSRYLRRIQCNPAEIFSRRSVVVSVEVCYTCGMSNVFTDWSALKKVVVNPPAEKPRAPVPPSRADEGREVIDYFRKCDVVMSAKPARESGGASDELSALRAAVNEMEKQKNEAIERAEHAEMLVTDTQRWVDELTKKLESIQSDNARLRGEAAKAASAVRVAQEESLAPTPMSRLGRRRRVFSSLLRALARRLRESFRRSSCLRCRTRLKPPRTAIVIGGPLC